MGKHVDTGEQVAIKVYESFLFNILLPPLQSYALSCLGLSFCYIRMQGHTFELTSLQDEEEIQVVAGGDGFTRSEVFKEAESCKHREIKRSHS